MLDSVIETPSAAPITIVSLRALLRDASVADGEEDILEQIFAQDRRTQNVLSGRPHKIIDKIALRDRPLLDEYQDAIFRLPIDTQVAILGPPGTGKTTTLIKRLGLKSDAATNTFET